jgi:hypothetical protein
VLLRKDDAESHLTTVRAKSVWDRLKAGRSVGLITTWSATACHQQRCNEATLRRASTKIDVPDASLRAQSATFNTSTTVNPPVYDSVGSPATDPGRVRAAAVTCSKRFAR